MGNRYKKKNRKKIIILVIVIIILFFIRKKIVNGYTIIVEKVNFNFVKYKRSMYKDAINFKQKIDIVSNSDKYIEDYKKLQENYQRAELNLNQMEMLKEENNQLRNTLNLKENLPFDTEIAEVILADYKDEGLIYISKGRNDGLALNQVVIYDGTMIGKITKLENTYSEVSLLTNKDLKISAIINDEDPVILRGNGNGTFSVKNYNKEIDIEKNNMFSIKTSGISDTILKDINIGAYYVKNRDLFKQTRELIFRPNYNYSKIKIVLIVKGGKK